MPSGASKQRIFGVSQPVEEESIFDFRTTVEGLLTTRWGSRAGKLLYSRVLWENTKKNLTENIFDEKIKVKTRFRDDLGKFNVLTETKNLEKITVKSLPEC